MSRKKRNLRSLRHLRNRRLRKTLESLEIFGFILLLLPLILIVAPVYLPFLALSERLRRCPLCGQRGSLQRVPGVWPAELEGSWGQGIRRRINPDLAQLRCSACGLNIRDGEL